MSTQLTTRSQVSTLLQALREERSEAVQRKDALAVKKIDLIGKSINRLVQKHTSA